MKILHLSDLHRDNNDKFSILEQNKWIKSLLYKLDIIVLTGDVFESSLFINLSFNPYKVLSELFYGCKVIFCLGNHEFFFRTVKDTKKYFSDLYDPYKYDVHCLDIIEYLDVEDIRFMGNVFWYDGSMKTVKNQNLLDYANGNWNDKTIREFDFYKEHDICKEQIFNALNTKGNKKSVLCTHCIPHHKLNLHLSNINNLYNAYSGSIDFLDNHKFDYCLCGHSHKRVIAEINDCKSINVGNDYFPPFMHYILEI